MADQTTPTPAEHRRLKLQCAELGNEIARHKKSIKDLKSTNEAKGEEIERLTKRLGELEAERGESHEALDEMRATVSKGVGQGFRVLTKHKRDFGGGLLPKGAVLGVVCPAAGVIPETVVDAVRSGHARFEAAASAPSGASPEDLEAVKAANKAADAAGRALGKAEAKADGLEKTVAGLKAELEALKAGGQGGDQTGKGAKGKGPSGTGGAKNDDAGKAGAS